MQRSDASSREIELARLLQGCAARDTRAFHALYDDTSPQLFAKLLRMLRSAPVAEEVLRDVYLRIWERAGSYQAHRGQALAWIEAIARNCAIARLGQEGVHDDFRREAPPAGDADVHHRLALAYVDGRSYEEIADITMDSPGAIRKQIRRELLRLRT
jgi:RNA polymerase sigma-70 factor (ECF subfamily)